VLACVAHPAAGNEVVGVVTATDREAAIQEAIELHQITDPEKQRRLVAWPEA